MAASLGIAAAVLFAATCSAEGPSFDAVSVRLTAPGTPGPYFLSDLGSRIGFAEGRGIVDGYRQPIIADKTGLPGTYTFLLRYYSVGYAATPDPAGGPDIFAGIRNQLGLRLEKTADVAADVIVIDRLDRNPTAN